MKRRFKNDYLQNYIYYGTFLSFNSVEKTIFWFQIRAVYDNPEFTISDLTDTKVRQETLGTSVRVKF